jgi:hypothetical protein
MIEYIIHFLLKTLVILGLANLCLAFVPAPIRKSIVGTFKFAYKITHFVVIQLKKVVKNICANYKEIEQPKKRKYTPRKRNTNSKVIQFPKEKIK